MGANKISSRRRLKLRQDELAQSDPQNHTLRTSTFCFPKPHSHWSATGPRNKHYQQPQLLHAHDSGNSSGAGCLEGAVVTPRVFAHCHFELITHSIMSLNHLDDHRSTLVKTLAQNPSYSLNLLCHSRTLARSPKISLKLQNHPKRKMCSMLGDTTLLLSGI
jgi:hypothetical protein